MDGRAEHGPGCAIDELGLCTCSHTEQGQLVSLLTTFLYHAVKYWGHDGNLVIPIVDDAPKNTRLLWNQLPDNSGYAITFVEESDADKESNPRT